jgi:hypothetical protein
LAQISPTSNDATPLLPDQQKILILLIEHGKLSKADYGKYFGDVAAINRKLTPVIGIKPIDPYADDAFYILNPQAKEKIKKLLGME